MKFSGFSDHSDASDRMVLARSSGTVIFSIVSGSSFFKIETEGVVMNKYTITYATCSVQGERDYQEDAYFVHHYRVAGKLRGTIFCVMDGHGGRAVSLSLQTFMPAILDLCLDSNSKGGDVPSAINEAFARFDQLILSDEERYREQGSTINLVYVDERNIYCANCGDTRSVAYGSGMVYPLSTDHKPDVQSELTRILDAGGHVEPSEPGDCYRVWKDSQKAEGGLAVSRAFGDIMYGANGPRLVVPVPDITVTSSKGVEFIIMGTDGLWDTVSNQECVNIVRGSIQKKMDIRRISKHLVDVATGRGSSDNITAVVVLLRSDPVGVEIGGNSAPPM